MTFSINLTNFRAFRETGDIKVAPITILTGTNSSGKSSFLGALKYLSDIDGFVSGGASFNKDPFLFGGFEQIVNGGTTGSDKLKSFTIGYRGPLLDASQRYFRRSSKKFDAVNFEITFSRSGTQPVVKRVNLFADNLQIDICIDYEKQEVEIKEEVDGDLKAYKFKNDMIPPDALFNNVAMISFIYDSVITRHTQARGNAFQNAMSGLAPDRIAYEHSQLIRGVLSSVPTTSFAGAPIRSRPNRTYDPSDPLPQAEGSHVPSQLAQLARQRPSEWAVTQKALNLFGKSSGLFDKLEVRALGDSESDPFQIEISLNGPKRNIVDVGYGVSQVFPLLFESLKRRSGELIMLQQPEVHLHPEAQAALGSFIVDDVKKKSGYYLIETHSDYLIDRIRQKIRLKQISAEEVSLLYFSQDDKGSHIARIRLNDMGEVLDPPENYRDFFLHEELNTLGF
jgi:AAA15 family ATPase/GTPase